MRNNTCNLFLILLVLLNILSCQKKVKHEFNYNKLSQSDLSFVPYHLGDILNLKDQSSGLITQFTCNYWKQDSTVDFSGCHQDDKVCIRNSSEYLIIKLGASTSDSIYKMQFNIFPSALEFEQIHTYLDLRGADYPATSNYTSGSYNSGQFYLD